MRVIQKFQDFHVDLYRNWTRLHELTMDFEISVPSHLVMTGHVCVEHRNLVDGPVGFALLMTIKQGKTQEELGPFPKDPFGTPGEWLTGSLIAGNISSYWDHYGYPSLEGYRLLEPGWYRVETWGNSHSSLAPTTDGLIHIQPKPYNQLIAIISEA